jgi:hypothetical protein
MGKTKRDRIRNQSVRIGLRIMPLKESTELTQLRWLGHVVRMAVRDAPKWLSKLEHRSRDPTEDSDRLGKKGYRRF